MNHTRGYLCRSRLHREHDLLLSPGDFLLCEPDVVYLVFCAFINFDDYFQEASLFLSSLSIRGRCAIIRRNIIAKFNSERVRGSIVALRVGLVIIDYSHARTSVWSVNCENGAI